MGLTGDSVGKGALRERLSDGSDLPRVALMGNPNVGKSSVFNALTGMNQHTGNWPGKTVAVASGKVKTSDMSFSLVDLPGTYSLLASSPEEEVARNHLLFEDSRLCVVVCDGTNPERGLPLVLQVLEITPRVIVCLNLMDEAKKKGVETDTEILSSLLGVPVICTSARNKKSLSAAAEAIAEGLKVERATHVPPTSAYPQCLEESVSAVEAAVEAAFEEVGASADKRIPARFIALRLLEGNTLFESELRLRYGDGFSGCELLVAALQRERMRLSELGWGSEKIKDAIVSTLARRADTLGSAAVKRKNNGSAYGKKDRRIDKLLTGRAVGYPLMILLLLFIFWLTVSGANYPSEWLAALFSWGESVFRLFLSSLSAPAWLEGILIDGMYGTLASVVSVMLPPMAIFFPLFTLLEDVGYLPRVAYNLDRPFCRCGSCGKQALTMCMGFGCNAAGVVGCRIINSPRERLLATVTNALVPCNGKFPTLIALISMFCVVSAPASARGVLSAIILTALILLGICATLIATKILSATLFKGHPSSFILEMPPFRMPRVGSIIVRSVLDRALFVLGRAAAVAIPMGAVIWLMANIPLNGGSLLSAVSDLLDPIGRLIGLDGVILTAFILGAPANEIVLPLIIMTYTACGSMGDVGSLESVRMVLTSNGWTWATAVSMMIFSLFHWPCSTTVLTVKKETGSLSAALLSIAVPTVIGMSLCLVFNLVVRLLGL